MRQYGQCHVARLSAGCSAGETVWLTTDCQSDVWSVTPRQCGQLSVRETVSDKGNERKTRLTSHVKIITAGCHLCFFCEMMRAPYATTTLPDVRRADASAA